MLAFLALTMATSEQCQHYDTCGLVKFRKAKPFFEVQPLPKDGDCGIPIEVCQRVNPMIPIPIEAVGPQTEREFNATLPPLSNQNNRPPRRIHGGGHK